MRIVLPVVPLCGWAVPYDVAVKQFGVLSTDEEHHSHFHVFGYHTHNLYDHWCIDFVCIQFLFL